MRRSTALLMTLAGLAAAGVLAAIGSTGWLLESAQPVRSDLLVVLAGGSAERVDTALELYRAGLAPAILVTSPMGYPAHEFSFLESSGVPRAALAPPLRPSGSTVEDALAIRDVAERLGVRSILVVTSPYHCRRARLVLEREFAGSGVRVHVTPSKSLYMEPRRWWMGRQGWSTLPAEYPKLLWAWLTTPRRTDQGNMTRTP